LILKSKVKFIKLFFLDCNTKEKQCFMIYLLYQR
jgi:hypothetical protein